MKRVRFAKTATGFLVMTIAVGVLSILTSFLNRPGDQANKTKAIWETPEPFPTPSGAVTANYTPHTENIPTFPPIFWTSTSTIEPMTGTPPTPYPTPTEPTPTSTPTP